MPGKAIHALFNRRLSGPWAGSFGQHAIKMLVCATAGAILLQIGITWTTITGTSPIFVCTYLLSCAMAIFVANIVSPDGTTFTARLISNFSKPNGNRRRQVMLMVSSLLVAGMAASLSGLLAGVFQLACDLLLPVATATTTATHTGFFDLCITLLVPCVEMSLMMLICFIWMALHLSDALHFSDALHLSDGSCSAEIQHVSATKRQWGGSQAAPSLWAQVCGMSVGGCLLLAAAQVEINVMAVIGMLLVGVTFFNLLHRWEVAVVGDNSGMAVAAGMNRSAPDASQFVAGGNWGFTLGFAVAGGLACAASIGVLAELVPVSWPVILLAGTMVSAVMLLLQHSLRRGWVLVDVISFTAVAILAMLPLLLAGVMDINLWVKTLNPGTWIVTALHAMQLSVVIWASVWIAYSGRWSTEVLKSESNRESGATGFGSSIATPALMHAWPLMFVCGVILCWALNSMATGSVRLLAAGVVFASLLQVAWKWRAGSGQRFARIGGARFGMLAMALACPFAARFASIDLATSSRLLFSDRTMTALHLGLDKELIAQSDAGRLLQEVITGEGKLQLWRRSSQILEFRRDGRLLGQISSDSGLTPQPVQDILPAVLPLVVHPRPDRILVIGDDTGACLNVCRKFPVQRIVAIRQCKALTKLVSEYSWSLADVAPDRDPRVTIRHAETPVVISQPPEVRFDVLISCQPATLTASQATELTVDFYQAASLQLAEDGVFCQRLPTGHLGPEMLTRIMGTVRSTFAHVIAVQTISGEMAILASNAEEGLTGKHLLSRLERSYVREEIATAGWDWSQVAILPMLDINDPVGLFGKTAADTIVTLRADQLALQLPFSLGLRSDWSVQMHQAFGAYQIRIGEAVPMGESQQEIKRRLTALSQQVEILAGMPDEPWTYRRSLRVEMQRSSRPPKEVVSNGKIVRVAHPTDKFHQDYLLQLGQSLQRVLRGDHRHDAFAGLVNFTEGYEPLVSLFAHYELVRLHELAGHPAPLDEFRHRLHTVYFTESSDASVRPVVAALQQLVDQPDLIASGADRYDHLNALVQKLIERWEARTAWEPRSASRVQNDVDRSVHAANRALQLMEELAASAGVQRNDFLKRRRFVNSALINPLRDYRDQVLAHRMKNSQAAPIGDEDPDDLPLLVNPLEGSPSQEVPTN